MTAELAGLGVLVTRPAHQAEPLCRLIEAHGGRPVRFPALDIQPPRDPEPARRLLAQDWDLLVFVSANAVTHALDLAGRLPAGRRAAVGRATAQALVKAGHGPDLVPERQDSEGLLERAELRHMAGQRVLIVRGEGGRPLLGDSLAARGARVSYAEVYRRVLPERDPASLLAHWDQEIQVVTATSAEVLENLAHLLGETGRARLQGTPLVVISERMEAAARAAGMTRLIRAPAADDGSVVAALGAWAAGSGPRIAP